MFSGMTQFLILYLTRCSIERLVAGNIKIEACLFCDTCLHRQIKSPISGALMLGSAFARLTFHARVKHARSSKYACLTSEFGPCDPDKVASSRSEPKFIPLVYTKQTL
jgi:hypothetical protein